MVFQGKNEVGREKESTGESEMDSVCVWERESDVVGAYTYLEFKLMAFNELHLNKTVKQINSVTIQQL